MTCKSHTLYILLLMLLATLDARAQEQLVQNVRGQVVDAESKEPITGVTIVLISDPQINDITDSDGYYLLKNVPIGRQAFKFIFAGYDTKTVSEILVTTGKETELNMSLTESLHQLKEVSVSANKYRSQALNEFATVSSRSFSVEETRRYAASIADPARAAMNFAGVSSNGDLDNDIVVRGNSPKGILWRLEGIEIPNPNHFSELGSTGGAVSMINANTLATSDFYTGAFPAEIGNALSGAFDLNLRNGNTNTNEYIAQVGLLGTEVAIEGPFKKRSRSSYLIDYRYSTLALVQDYLDLNGLIPNYQDLTFKFNFPTKKAGTFSVFGIGGMNKILTDPENDSTRWNDTDPNLKLDNRSKTGVAGIEHQYFLNHRSYIKAVLSGSYEQSVNRTDTLSTLDNYANIPYTGSNYRNTAFRLSVVYNNKISERSTLRAGIIAQQIDYHLDRYYYHTIYTDSFNNTGKTGYYQAFAQWKNRLSEHFTFIGGVNASYYTLNNKYSIEPRASLSYATGRNRFTLSAGLHSKPDIQTYLYSDTPGKQPNKNLDLLRAAHSVLGYDVSLPFKLHLKLEAYYQYLYHIPVEADTASGFSLINNEGVAGLYKVRDLVSEGSGQNYGIDMVLERPFTDNYYVLLTSSLFKSTYTNYKGDTYESHFDKRYLFNIVFGKEFYFNAKKHSLIGLNGKVISSRGQRESPIDYTASITENKTVYVSGQYYSLKDPAYFRCDASAYYKLNNKRATHTIALDIQNVTNRRNFSYTYFDMRSNSIKNVLETGLIPSLSYRIEFH
ncbi:MAG: hypothetical protein BGO70_09025 [Bacteroidetes bacterium 43-93]|nr:TonB-dependent receptor [Bacteroidota bacterium]OJX00308.1 MAG: hypothetical protein BGO70_09025 [Bacteroidetes bacterium 43-93]